jgi:hypothetical protein
LVDIQEVEEIEDLYRPIDHGMDIRAVHFRRILLPMVVRRFLHMSWQAVRAITKNG